MAWITVETNQYVVITRVNSVLYDLTTHDGVGRLKDQVMEAVYAAARIEEPLESLEDDT